MMSLDKLQKALERLEVHYPDEDESGVIKISLGRYMNGIMLMREYIKEQSEPVKVKHRHEWFRTGEMKVGQMRCISCGMWAQE
jgi:acyl-CoA synthetase (AMP-forming)/AMP-acid ligase II